METPAEKGERLWTEAQAKLKALAPLLKREHLHIHDRFWTAYIHHKAEINLSAIHVEMINSGILTRLNDGCFGVYWRCWGRPCRSSKLDSDQSAAVVASMQKDFGFIFDGGRNKVVRRGGENYRYILGWDPLRVPEEDPPVGKRIRIPQGTLCAICQAARATEWDHRVPREACRQNGLPIPTIENMTESERGVYFQPVCKGCNMKKKGQCDKCLRGQRPDFIAGLRDVDRWRSEWELGDCKGCCWSRDREIVLAPGDRWVKEVPPSKATILASPPQQKGVVDFG